MTTLDDLCEPWPADEAPWLDQPDVRTQHPRMTDWQRDGAVILKRFIPDQLIDAYQLAWLDDNGCQSCSHDGWAAEEDLDGRTTHQGPCPRCDGSGARRPMGWPYNTPYMHVPAVRDLCCHEQLSNILHALIGEPMGVHLNLTGWRSTQRNWHQDGYLNPDTTADWYAAVWFALDDIHPASGPFQFIPGSHRRFGIIRQDRMLAALTPEEVSSPLWPKHSERILTPLFEKAIADEGMIPVNFLAERGDVLIWHSRLLHRGSVPRDPTLERRALIAHYSGIHHRSDMPPARRHGEGWYFPIHEVR